MNNSFEKPQLLMASYVTYKSLYDKGHFTTPYQIMAQFVKQIILTEQLTMFTSATITQKIKDAYGFSVPSAVLKKTLKKVDNVYASGTESDVFLVNKDIEKTDGQFNDLNLLAKERSETVICELCSFVEKETKEKLSYQKKKRVEEEFISYLLDESNGDEYQELISSFLLKNENNEELIDKIQDIREGCILYTGINYNISETGSITDDLVLFLDMEVLFDLVGLNGTVFQELAKDMYKLVKEANQKKKRISLCYFEQTRKNIEHFFAAAESILNGTSIQKDSTAMNSILSKCKSASDVVDQQSDFFYRLKYEYGVGEEKPFDYYEESLQRYNFRSPEDLQEIQENIELISKINILRKGEPCKDYLKARYILVSETRKTIELSNKYLAEMHPGTSEGNYAASYAVNMSFITNLLWYKLNKGFGRNEFPKNIDVVIKAKLVLASCIGQRIQKSYDDCMNEYNQGKLTADQVQARLYAIHQKMSNPEDITAENIDDCLDFNPEVISRIEREAKIQREELLRKEKQIANLQDSEDEKQKQIKKMGRELYDERKGRLVAEENLKINQSVIEKQTEELHKNEELIREYKEKEEEQKKKRTIFKIIGMVIGFLLIVVLFFFLLKAILVNFFNADTVDVLSILISVVLGIPTIVKVAKELCKYYKDSMGV